MTAPEAVVVSYRLGGADGVAVEAAKWEWALRNLGFAVRRVAGEFETLRPDDTWLPFLAIDPVDGTILVGATYTGRPPSLARANRIVGAKFRSISPCWSRLSA